MKCVPLVAAALTAASALASAHADIIRFTFTGVVTSISGNLPTPAGVEVGAPYVFTYAFDSTTADTNPAPNIGDYPAILRGSMTINGFVFALPSGSIHITNNGFVGDSYRGQIQNDTTTAFVSLTNIGGAAFNSDAMPTDLAFSQFTARTAGFQIFEGENSLEVIGDVQTFERTAITCACDWNLSGNLNSQDFFDFLTDFFADEGDFNRDNTTNSQDFFDFVTCFFGSCPG